MNRYIAIIFCFGLIMNYGYSQNKKEQIEVLNFSIDSLKDVIKAERIISQEKSSEIEFQKKQINELNEVVSFKQTEIDNLKKENSLILEKSELINSDNQLLSTANAHLKSEIDNLKKEYSLILEKNELTNSKNILLTIDNGNLKSEIENLKKEIVIEKKYEFIYMNYTNSNDEPYSDLGFRNTSDSTIVKIATVLGWLENISIDEFESHGIPKKAKAALGSWYAGEGSYFYYVEENGFIKVYKGWINESDHSSYHWVICNNIE